MNYSKKALSFLFLLSVASSAVAMKPTKNLRKVITVGNKVLNNNISSSYTPKIKNIIKPIAITPILPNHNNIYTPIKLEIENNDVNKVSTKNISSLVVKKHSYKGLNLNSLQKRSFHKTVRQQGPIGSTIGAVIGKAIPYVVQKGIAGGVTIVVTMYSGPVAGVMAGEAVDKALIIPVEIISTKMAIAGGILGGVLTGPT